MSSLSALIAVERSIERRRAKQLEVADLALRKVRGEARYDIERRKRAQLWAELEAEARRPLIPGQPEHLAAVSVVRQIRRTERLRRKAETESQDGGTSP